MTGKLRRKFVAYASLSVFGLLLIILSVINITNFSIVASSGDSITLNLASEGGRYNEQGQGGGPFTPGRPSRPDAPDSPDMQGSVRYFTVSFSNGTPTIYSGRLDNVDDMTKLEWAGNVFRSNKTTGWYATYYRFRRYVNNGSDYVSFVDLSRELSPSYNVLYASIGGGLGGILLTTLILIPVSKLLVKPTEEAWRKQKRFVSDASHELKTPLSIISANNEINEIANGENEQTKAIAKQVHAMNRLVRSLNALAKLEEGETFVKTEMDLSSIAEEIASGFASKNADKTFDINIQEGIAYQGTEVHIRSLLQTALDNAFKYGLTQVSFSLSKAGDRILILVDNDANLSEEGQLDRVFERFYRSDEARASSTEGSGIGLSLAKEIVNAHKGRIFARSENGHFILKIEL